jgi:hypothetical protein
MFLASFAKSYSSAIGDHTHEVHVVDEETDQIKLRLLVGSKGDSQGANIARTTCNKIVAKLNDEGKPARTAYVEPTTRKSADKPAEPELDTTEL